MITEESLTSETHLFSKEVSRPVARGLEQRMVRSYRNVIKPNCGDGYATGSID